MNSAWPLISAGLLMGAGGSLHCLTMCSGLQRMTLRGIPIVTVRPLPGGGPKAAAADTAAAGFKLPDGRWWRFQAGRLLGYTLLGGVAGLVGEQLLAAASWQPVFESAWASMNALLVLLGLCLLVLGREPVWLAMLGSRLASFAPLSPGARTEWVRGMLWALLPCGLLYTALGTALLAASPLGAAAVMAAFALGTNLSLFLMEAGARNLMGRIPPHMAYRFNGALLIVLAAAGLTAALHGHAHPYC